MKLFVLCVLIALAYVTQAQAADQRTASTFAMLQQVDRLTGICQGSDEPYADKTQRACAEREAIIARLGAIGFIQQTGADWIAPKWYKGPLHSPQYYKDAQEPGAPK